MSGPLELTPQLFVIFSDLVEQASGITYGPAERALFESKLVTRAVEQGYDTLLDYYYRLRYDDQDGQELRGLVEALVVHETYFFRELAPLVELVDGHIASAVAERGRARVWSAACATGEEPYTLAILLAERGLLDKVEIVASDISSAAVARARAGQHGRRALRDGHPTDLAARYLESTREGGVRVIPRLRHAVRFEVANLVEPPDTFLGRFDAILCRNVLIYFSDRVVVSVLGQLANVLAQDGVLLVGVSESLLRYGTRLTCEERGGTFFYRSAR